MSRIDFQDCLVVGVDIHKNTNVAVLETPFCQTLEVYKFENSRTEIDKFFEQVKKKAGARRLIFGLEDCSGSGKKLAQYLSQQGILTYHIPSNYTEKERKKSIHTDKTDTLDAKRVAEVLLTKSDRLPPLMITEETESSKRLKQIIADRQELTLQKQKLKQQLHLIFYEIFGINYKKRVKYYDIFCKRALKAWMKFLSKGKGYIYSRARLKIKRLESTKLALTIQDEILKDHTKDNFAVKQLKSMDGCGDIIASKIVSEIEDIKKYRSAAQLAKYAGIAPTSFSSAGKNRHHTDFRGNRLLNNGIHLLALSQISRYGSEEAKKYYRNKISEGKSKLHAMRCLKRRLVDIIYAMLKNGKMYNMDEVVKKG